MRHLKLIQLETRKSNSSSQEPPLLMRGPAAADDDPAQRDLEVTPRELEVEDLLCRGYSQENIAAIFGRSVNTISTHALSLYRKRRVHTQVGLLLAYLERKGIFVFEDEATDAYRQQASR